MDYQRGIVTAASVWRAIVLYGANSATYKFAFGATLLEAAATERTYVTIEELAPRYAELICAGIRRQRRQATAAHSRFLDACQAFNDHALDRETLHRRTAQLGFTNVITAFPRLGGQQAPIRFYDDERTKTGGGLRLHDELLALARSVDAADLDAETAARWRLVETAWATRVAGGLLRPAIAYDPNSQHLVLPHPGRRKPVTGIVPALNGYQDGRCAYCDQPMTGNRLRPVVEHVLPWVLLTRRWNGPDLDAVWNLVLACQPCNQAKQGRAPHQGWMPWLERRNNDLIDSRHPLREVLLAQTGQTPAVRHATLKSAYQHAAEALPTVWLPPVLPSFR